MDQMTRSGEWILVRADVLPEVYRKVLEVSTALATGRYASVSEAVRAVGISRSAYYKYKDTVSPYLNNKADAVFTTVELVLQDSPGVLSGLLSAFAKAGANIVTVNQQSPEDGSACVSICAKTDGMSQSMDKFANELSHVPGVRRVSAISQQGRSQKGGEV